MALDPVSTATMALTQGGVSPAPGATKDASGFGSTLNDLLGPVDQSTSEANQAVANMLDGTGDVHSAVIAMEKSDLTLQLTVQIRNKLVQAYQDVMRMPV